MMRTMSPTRSPITFCMFSPLLLAGCLPCWTRAAKKGRSPSSGPGPYKKAARNRWLL
jgi:hypothetical protein